MGRNMHVNMGCISEPDEKFENQNFRANFRPIVIENFFSTQVKSDKPE